MDVKKDLQAKRNVSVRTLLLNLSFYCVSKLIPIQKAAEMSFYINIES